MRNNDEPMRPGIDSRRSGQEEIQEALVAEEAVMIELRFLEAQHKQNMFELDWAARESAMALEEARRGAQDPDPIGSCYDEGDPLEPPPQEPDGSCFDDDEDRNFFEWEREVRDFRL